ncbi:MAG: sigma-70 family RNA polymerase sigma factor [Candidatus Phocaeicola merdigallinarum]|nr:sigma-70 family RNA polymerase sigma factor [Candidatus Phocaeicola merdigallinarum]
MKDLTHTSNELIARIFADQRQSVFFYVYKKIGKKEDSEDLVQDAYLRLLEYRTMLRPDTVKYFLFTIVRNLVTDYFRRFYKRQEVVDFLQEFSQTRTMESDSHVIVKDLQKQEWNRVRLLPRQRRKIYVMNRFEGKNLSEIASELHLSQRTVENHLFISRKEVRMYMKQCI